MLLLRVDITGGSQSILVPAGATSLLKFRAITPDTSGKNMILSAVGSTVDSWSKATTGTSKGVIAISDVDFEVGQFPVSQGETLLVAAENTGTAILYFDDSN